MRYSGKRRLLEISSRIVHATLKRTIYLLYEDPRDLEIGEVGHLK